MKIFRCFTEKKKGIDTEAVILLNELTGFVKIYGLNNIRILNRYDIKGINESVYEKSKFLILASNQTDDLYDEQPPDLNDYSFLLPVEALPGQYDQRADACEASFQLINEDNKRPIVSAAKYYVFYGKLTKEDKDKISKYLVNPLESQIASFDKQDSQTASSSQPQPDEIRTITGFISADDTMLSKYLRAFNLAMDISDIRFLQDYFKNTEKRDPTETEVRVIDTYWSDHCRHTTFFTELNDINIQKADVKSAFERYLEVRNDVYGENAKLKPVTLMDIATLPARALRKKGKLQNIDISDEVNACSIHIDVSIDGRIEDWLLMFKNETHNHPTEIEPFGGASTCVGGAIRDPLSGRAYVYQAMRITGAGDPRAGYDETLPGKIPQKQLTLTAARGNSSYGNEIGLPSGFIHEIYHPGYIAKRMELGAVTGAVKAGNIIRETPKPGDKVLLLGGRTGRDGIGAAAGSSKTQTDVSKSSLAAEVQKGNAGEERGIQRLFLDPDVTKIIKRCNDFGAGGVSVAVGELADGIDINLSLVHLKYDGLNGTEIALSESQERMALVISPDDVDFFIGKAKNENLEAYIIAEVTETPRMVMRYNNKIIVDISRDFLSTNGAARNMSIVVKAPENELSGLSECNIFPSKPSERLKALVEDLRFCSQRGLYEMFDGTVGTLSILMKNGGLTQDTPVQVMASLLPVPYNSETTTCSVMAYGFDPVLSMQDPFKGAKTAVLTSVAKLAASGCHPDKVYLSFQEYFEALRNDPVRWGKPFSALLGAFEIQMDLGLAAIGGKDSMSGSFKEIDVPPTLVSFAIAPNEAEFVITPEFKSPGHNVVLFNSSKTPAELKLLWRKIRHLIETGVIISAWAVTEGGAAEGIFKMAIGNKIGFKMTEDINPDILFEYDPGSIVAEVTESVENALILGYTIDEPVLDFNSDIITLEELKAKWSSPLEAVFPTKLKTNDSKAIDKLSYNKRAPVVSGERFSKPGVSVLTAPGTTGELDIARVIHRCGGTSEIVLIGNKTRESLNCSISKTISSLKENQILVLPAALTYGDEPGGPAKFLSAFLRIPALRDAIHEFSDNKNKLILGIGNGFQTLVNLGLLPFGRILDPMEIPDPFKLSDKPAFTANQIGRYISTYIHTRISSVKSPWMNLCNIDDIYTLPVSHGSGRLIISDRMLSHLTREGLVATQYTDPAGNPNMDRSVNPNGSDFAIEGLFDYSGNIFGKMGHMERYNDKTAKNIYGNKYQPVLEGGINYFK